MAAAQRDIEIVRGDGYRHKLEFVVYVNGVETPLDVTDYTITAAVKDWWTGSVKEDFVIDEAATNRSGGIVWIVLDEDQTVNALLPARSVWDVQYVTIDNPQPTTFLRGNVKLLGQATT